MLERYRSYRWADEAHDLAWTVAVISGRRADDVVTLYGADPGSPEELSFGEAEQERNEHLADPNSAERGLLQVLTRDGHVVVIEPNGWLGAEPQRARKISEDHCHFFSIYWSPVATRIVQAVDGQLVADFEPLFTDRASRPAGRYPDWIDEYLWPADGLQSTMLVALAEQTGVAFDRQWLYRRLPTYRVLPATTG